MSDLSPGKAWVLLGKENERLRALNAELVEALELAPEPIAEHAWLLAYVEWHKTTRRSALAAAKNIS